MGHESSLNNRNNERRDIGAWGRYRTGRGVARDVKILDVNEKGCRFLDRFGSLKRDDRITLKIGNIGPILSYVRWAERQEFGIQFDEPLYGAVLDHITQYFDERTAEEKAQNEKSGD